MEYITYVSKILAASNEKKSTFILLFDTACLDIGNVLMDVFGMNRNHVVEIDGETSIHKQTYSYSSLYLHTNTLSHAHLHTNSLRTHLHTFSNALVSKLISFSFNSSASIDNSICIFELDTRNYFSEMKVKWFSVKLSIGFLLYTVV